MKNKEVVEHIVNWLKKYSGSSKTEGYVVGISGGIDSALTSTLCALTGEKVICLNMPIRQMKHEYDRGNAHIEWLKQNFKNVSSAEVNLTPIFEVIENSFESEIQDFLTMANTRARLRMTTLYAYAGHHKLLVAGTGNKIEDFGIGFFTKYGDGLLPNVNDSLKFGYTTKQLNTCLENEKNYWGFFVKDNKLFDNDLKIVSEFTTDGPFTRAISKDCPPRIAMWIGRQIVKSYMEHNEKVTLNDLMNEKDSQKILSKSKYKP